MVRVHQQVRQLVQRQAAHGLTRQTPAAQRRPTCLFSSRPPPVGLQGYTGTTQVPFTLWKRPGSGQKPPFRHQSACPPRPPTRTSFRRREKTYHCRPRTVVRHRAAASATIPRTAPNRGTGPETAAQDLRSRTAGPHRAALPPRPAVSQHAARLSSLAQLPCRHPLAQQHTHLTFFASLAASPCPVRQFCSPRTVGASGGLCVQNQPHAAATGFPLAFFPPAGSSSSSAVVAPGRWLAAKERQPEPKVAGAPFGAVACRSQLELRFFSAFPGAPSMAVACHFILTFPVHT